MTTSKPKTPKPDGFTKEELAAFVITAGIFAGPYGKVVMDSTGREQLEGVADTALQMFDILVERIAARHA